MLQLVGGAPRNVTASARLTRKADLAHLRVADDLVADDADIRRATAAAAIGRFFNAGQACLAVKRVFVFDSVADEFIDKICARAKRLKIGKGTDAGAQMGPLHTEKQRAEIESQLADAVERGGKVVAGGKRPSGEEFDRGYFFRADGGGRRTRRRARLDRRNLWTTFADHARQGSRRSARKSQRF